MATRPIPTAATIKVCDLVVILDPPSKSFDRPLDTSDGIHLPFGSPAILESFAAVSRLEADEDPWLCVPGFSQVYLFEVTKRYAQSDGIAPPKRVGVTLRRLARLTYMG